MRKVTGHERKLAREAFDAIFTNPDPYGEPFRSDLPARRLIYPTRGYYLTALQFSALQQAAITTGDSTAYIIDVRSWPQIGWSDNRRVLWAVDLNDYRSYWEPPADAWWVMIENAIFSPTGRWGVLISDEAHAISAGSTEFDIALSAGLGPGNTGASEDWLAYWRTMAQDGADISWLRLHLAHIYGAPAAERLLTPYPW